MTLTAVNSKLEVISHGCGTTITVIRDGKAQFLHKNHGVIEVPIHPGDSWKGTCAKCRKPFDLTLVDTQG